MNKILTISYKRNEVQVGLEDGSLRKFSVDDFSYSPLAVGDIVEIYEGEGITTIVKSTNTVRVSGNSNTGNQKSRLTAGLLGIFLGGWGIHNFYLGNNKTAIWQLILWIIGVLTVIVWIVPVVWGFVEGILIITSKPGSQWHQDADGEELID